MLWKMFCWNAVQRPPQRHFMAKRNARTRSCRLQTGPLFKALFLDLGIGLSHPCSNVGDAELNNSCILCLRMHAARALSSLVFRVLSVSLFVVSHSCYIIQEYIAPGYLTAVGSCAAAGRLDLQFVFEINIIARRSPVGGPDTPVRDIAMLFIRGGLGAGGSAYL